MEREEREEVISPEPERHVQVLGKADQVEGEPAGQEQTDLPHLPLLSLHKEEVTEGPDGLD